MTYLVTESFEEADKINKLFLRVWAQGLLDDGYGVNGDGEPSTGIQGGKRVSVKTTDWFVPKRTLGGKWAVLVPEEKDTPKFKEIVRRSFEDISGLVSTSMDFATFKSALGLSVEQLTTAPLNLTVQQWGTAALISSGIQYEIVEDGAVKWNDDV